MIPDQFLTSIGENPFNTAVSESHAWAREFLNFTDSETFFDQSNWPQHHTRCQQIIDLGLFASSVFGLRILPFEKDWPASQNGFASWLHRSSENQFNIAVFVHQLHAWEQAGGVSRSAQFVRSIIHEIGHFRLSRIAENTAAVGFSPSASPEEEEKAWVFTFTFLGILAGDYSFRRRKGNDNQDDCPKLHV